MQVLVANSMVVVNLQFINVSNQHVAHFKYVMYQSYLNKAGKNKRN